MGKFIAWALLLSAAAFGTTANAKVFRCEGCSASELRQMALRLGEGKHILISLSTGEMKAYEVVIEGAPGNATPSLEPWMPPAEITGAFNVALDFHAATGGAMAAHVEIDGDALGLPGLDSASAYDVMSDVVLRVKLGDRLYAGPLPGVAPVVSRAAEQIRQFGFPLVGVPDATIRVSVRLDQDTVVVYRIDQDRIGAEYLVGLSRTADGEAIPETNSPIYEGSWHDKGLPGLADYMAGMHAAMADSGQGKYLARMTCNWIENSGRGSLHCIRHWTAPQ